MFGHAATLPVDINMNKMSAEDYVELPHEYDEKIHQEMQKKRFDTMVLATRYILAAQEKQKQYYDSKRANPHLFTVGQQVLLKYLVVSRSRSAM